MHFTRLIEVNHQPQSLLLNNQAQLLRSHNQQNTHLPLFLIAYSTTRSSFSSNNNYILNNPIILFLPRSHTQLNNLLFPPKFYHLNFHHNNLLIPRILSYHTQQPTYPPLLPYSVAYLSHDFYHPILNNYILKNPPILLLLPSHAILNNYILNNLLILRLLPSHTQQLHTQQPTYPPSHTILNNYILNNPPILLLLLSHTILNNLLIPLLLRLHTQQLYT